MVDRVLTVKQVADYLQVNERTVYRMAGASKLPAFKVGGLWRFKEKDVQVWIEKSKNEVK